MATIKDYISWRGDLTFEAAPFNEVDNYIISKIGCFDFTGIVPGDFTRISIGDAVKGYYEKFGAAGDYQGLLASKHIAEVIKMLPGTARYKGLMLSGFVKSIDVAADKQFSALTVTLPDGVSYVSFRGTDDSLLAWKENLMMGIEKGVPAQKAAIEYLNRTASVVDGPLIVGGHSKGGNLAVFAAANAHEALQARIIQVYSNDGPGFYPEFLKEPGYLRIRDKVTVLVPRNSIVGTLLTQDDNLQAIECDKMGGVSHDGFTWQVMGPSFVHCESLGKGSQAFENGLTAVLDPMSVEERKAFLDEIFEAFEATGASTLTDLTEHRVKQAGTLLKSFRNSPEARRFVSMVLGQTVKDYMPQTETAHAVKAIKGSSEKVLKTVKTHSERAVKSGAGAIKAEAQKVRGKAEKLREEVEEEVKEEEEAIVRLAPKGRIRKNQIKADTLHKFRKS